MICWIEFSAGFVLGSDEALEERAMMNIHSQITDSEHELPENGWEGWFATEVTQAASPRPRPTISIFGEVPVFP
jgi:hypothetical protein